MDNLAYKIILKFNEVLLEERQSRYKGGQPPLSKVTLIILGQFSLLIDKELNEKLTISSTFDFDAVLKGDPIARSLLKVILDANQLSYDDLSNEIWMPKETIYNVIHESKALTVKVPAPIYSLTSKAIKAPDKNRILVRDALKIYDKELKSLIIKYGGDLRLFEEI